MTLQKTCKPDLWMPGTWKRGGDETTKSRIKLRDDPWIEPFLLTAIGLCFKKKEVKSTIHSPKLPPALSFFKPHRGTMRQRLSGFGNSPWNPCFSCDETKHEPSKWKSGCCQCLSLVKDDSIRYFICIRVEWLLWSSMGHSSVRICDFFSNKANKSFFQFNLFCFL